MQPFVCSCKPRMSDVPQNVSLCVFALRETTIPTLRRAQQEKEVEDERKAH